MTILGTTHVNHRGFVNLGISEVYTDSTVRASQWGLPQGQVAKRGGAAGEVLGNLADVNSMKAFLAVILWVTLPIRISLSTCHSCAYALWHIVLSVESLAASIEGNGRPSCRSTTFLCLEKSNNTIWTLAHAPTDCITWTLQWEALPPPLNCVLFFVGL